jgi:hypothetical protein
MEQLARSLHLVGYATRSNRQNQEVTAFLAGVYCGLGRRPGPIRRALFELTPKVPLAITAS